VKNRARSKTPDTSDNKGGSATWISSRRPRRIEERPCEDFREKALELGLSMAKIIAVSWAEVDERVGRKKAPPIGRTSNSCSALPLAGPAQRSASLRRTEGGSSPRSN